MRLWMSTGSGQRRSDLKVEGHCRSQALAGSLRFTLSSKDDAETLKFNNVFGASLSKKSLTSGDFDIDVAVD